MNRSSIESLLLKNKNVATHPQLATALTEYAALVSNGYVPSAAVLQVIANLEPTSATAQASLTALETVLHSVGLVNTAPTAVADMAATDEDTSITINVYSQ